MLRRQSVSGRALVVGAATASLLLVVVYLAAGGGTYEPTRAADPCDPRAWTDPDDLEESAQQFLLSALDGAACELGVSREELAVALATEESRREFAAEQGIDDLQLEFGIRAGLRRAIDDAERAGVLSPLVAGGARALADRIPVEEAIALISGAEDLFEGAGGIIDDIVDQADDLLP
jgi:hypothetical protein